jgi:hypothetical protein
MAGSTRSVVLAAVLGSLAGACGGGFTPGAAFRPDEAVFFDDGVDLLRELPPPGSQLSLSYSEQFDARVSLADLVARVEIVTVQTTKDLDGRMGKRIIVNVVEEIYGLSPARNLILRSSPDSIGYTLIERHEAELTGRFVAFLRFFDEEDGALGRRFHLSPDSRQVLEHVHAKIGARRKIEGGGSR